MAVPVAGDNEKKFKPLFEEKIGKDILKGKAVYKSANVSISADNNFSINNKHYLIEIDSGNMAKLLVGQYTLLSKLYSGLPENAHFLIIHTYNNYNVQRTLNNLKLVKKACNLRLSFSAMHIDTLENWEGGSLVQFIGLASK